MIPRWPVYVISRGRAETCTTPAALDRMGIPYRLVVEADELDAYSRFGDKLLVLPRHVIDNFDMCGDREALPYVPAEYHGPGPARQFVLEHACNSDPNGMHWIMDDNIKRFGMVRRRKMDWSESTWDLFVLMEHFVAQFANIAQASPNGTYLSLFSRLDGGKRNLIINDMVYCCLLNRNDLPDYRGLFSEDYDMTMRLLKAGWCTVRFKSFAQDKAISTTVPGGSTEAYLADRKYALAMCLYRRHPDVCVPPFQLPGGYWGSMPNDWRSRLGASGNRLIRSRSQRLA